MWAVVNFLLILLVNLILLFGTNEQFHFRYNESPVKYSFFVLLIALQFLACILSLLSYLIQAYPVLIVKYATEDTFARAKIKRLLPRVNRANVQILIENEY